MHNPSTSIASSPTDIVPVNVDAELIEGKSFQIPIHDNQVYSSLLPVFRCRFADVSEDSYVYDVHWYINGVSVKSHLNVPFSNINVTRLRNADWINKFRMNMEVLTFKRFVFFSIIINIPILFFNVKMTFAVI